MIGGLAMKEQERKVCNCCGKELRVTDGHYEDYLHIVKNWGYLSDRDGTTEEMNICPECFRAWTNNFAVAPDHYPTTELL